MCIRDRAGPAAASGRKGRYHTAYLYPQRPHAAEGVAADEVVGVKFHHGGCDHIQEGFDRRVLRVDVYKRQFSTPAANASAKAIHAAVV